METQRWQLAKDLFHQALELSREERGPFLTAACADDSALLAELNSMLDAHHGADEFLADPSSAVRRIHATSSAAAELHADGDRLGDFHLVRELGRGGMGVVYEAEQHSLRRPVALKLLTTALTLQRGALARFQREAELAAKLDHPSVVRVLAAGEEGGVAFLAMELIDGLPLDQLIRDLRSAGLGEQSGPRMAALIAAKVPRRSTSAARAGHPETWGGSHIQAACHIVGQIAEGLEQAHERGIVHRAVKPANILLRPDGSAVLTDFGLAFARDLPGLSRTGDVLGTPAYLSPEQARGRHAAIDQRTDVYSLGVTLYELLSLRRPHEVEGLNEALTRIQADEPLPLAQLNPRVPADLSTVVHKALEKDPARRYQSAGALAADLRAFLEHRPVAARPPSVSYRVTRFSRRHRALMAGATAVFLTLVGGLFATTRMATEARAARDEEAEQRKSAERELAIRTQLFEFVHQVLTDFEPGEGDMSVREMVDRAAAHVEAGLGEDPRVEAEIRSMLAYNYRRMGAPKSAEPHARRHVELIEELHGPDAEETLDALTTLGAILQDDERVTEAEPIVRRVADRRLATLGESDPRTLEAQGYLTVTLQRLGKLEDAEAAMLALAERYSTLGAHEFERAMVQYNLAFVRIARGQPAGALEMLREAVPVAVAKFGEADAQTYQVLRTLADATHANGDPAGAVAILTDALERCRVHLGPSHPSTIKLVLRLTLWQEAQGDLAAAAACYEDLATALRARGGPADADLGLVLHYWAENRARCGELETAEQLVREAAGVFIACSAPPPGPLRHVSEALDEILRKRNVSPAALAEALGPLLERQRRNVPPEHIDLIMPHALTGAALLDSDDLAGAEPLVREAVRIAALHWTGETPHLSSFLSTRMLLAEILLRGGQHYEAEQLFLDAYERLRATPADLSLKARAAERLADSYQQRGVPEAANQWRARCEALRSPSGG